MCALCTLQDKAVPFSVGHRVSNPDVLSQRHIGGVMRNISCPETPTRQFHRNMSARSVQSEPATPYMMATVDSGEKGERLVWKTCVLIKYIAGVNMTT